MQAIRKRYFPALAEYIRSGSEASLFQATELGKMLGNVHPEEIIAVHDECMQTLVLNVESEEGIRLYNRSFMFLIELMVAYRFRNDTEKTTEQKFTEMREMLFKSHRSSERVKNKYENVLQHMDSGIALFDSNGTLTFVNLMLARMLDIPRKTLVGRTIRGLMLHPKLTRSTRKMIVRLYKEAILRRNRYFEFQDNAGRHFLVTVTYGDQLEGDILISIKDVSEYKQIEQTAYQNDKLAMLGKIAAAIAHEIRNPLTSIRGFIQLLRPHLLQLGKDEYARIIVAEIDRANDIIYEFLNSSKPTAPMKQEVSINALLKEVILLTESEALMRGCLIQLEAYEETLLVSIDVKQVKQVILNIMKNSLDAIEEINGSRNGRIDVIVQRTPEGVEITLRDNGKGMDRTTLGRLFDPFFTTKEAGTGLGLSVSYRIIRNHGGTIRVDSVPDEGTSFMIHLPLIS
ncbi:ATP-binding protein [Paenibacillus sp. MMS18-CY102]|uniref:ATP-binding protein n=1 Tax=Paenibacillus sp. MMS18-CY102 TaxID=2682849 RepID=UPI0013656A6E|nr:ATP-binding protein [Paenibacillus sp. MMS18-CY102]MWC29032.1 PAS domain S-box protein [Paenibacillus sp. MMS18-CY102]